ncbi:MAG: AtpZ/AtpI family protein [Flavobacteriales bacterium]|jgi:F0F1-type ATP synthase assembly protein I|nr:AtpZ/AtpI family protein [Flavobacteriales bacterium]MBQ1969363.1 AtpZ/AtpI family protein [Flavobacteriales bacterium]MBQ5815355.1 AtpZ/AtpI family protein [Flavobacteriales bacterium]MBR4403270.1 AtpZ/AtpI family protein [Flavobacteriales bacterium]
MENRKKFSELSSEEKRRRTQEYIQAYARYSGLAIQMIVLIGGGAYLGVYLDGKYDTSPVWTVVFSLLGVVLSLLMLFKSLVAMQNFNKRMEAERRRREEGKNDKKQ